MSKGRLIQLDSELSLYQDLVTSARATIPSASSAAIGSYMAGNGSGGLAAVVPVASGNKGVKVGEGKPASKTSRASKDKPATAKRTTKKEPTTLSSVVPAPMSNPSIPVSSVAQEQVEPMTVPAVAVSSSSTPLVANMSEN